MKYTLENKRIPQAKGMLRAGIKRFAPLMASEKRNVITALVAIVVNSMAALVAPVIIGRTIDTYIRLKDSQGLLTSSLLLLAVYLGGVVASYLQVRTMGGVGRRVLFRLRNALFTKLQELH